ncbi:hypothetical protein N0V84_012378 [Fusarium piperis]|uniref:Uncharacterized protein n=1 Tax=Fusarium piperis TaxID=1435070 RepID=A0A9W8TBK5_9HYPO|nr:hypothetical protein N0V84_012378 [Fusarium piperis]
MTHRVRPMSIGLKCSDCMVMTKTAKIMASIIKDTRINIQPTTRPPSDRAETMSLSDVIITKLKEFSNVPVYVGEKESTLTDSISISPVKLDELVTIYESVHSFVIVWTIDAMAFVQ